MTDEERTKARNKDRLEGDEAMMIFWSLFAACALAGGDTVIASGKKADAMIDQVRQRFT